MKSKRNGRAQGKGYYEEALSLSETLLAEGHGLELDFW